LPTAEQHGCCLAIGHLVWDGIPVWTPIDTTSECTGCCCCTFSEEEVCCPPSLVQM
jgi:hypothetical protein